MTLAIQKISDPIRAFTKSISIPTPGQMQIWAVSHIPPLNGITAYRVTQMGLLSMSCIGVIHSVGLLAIGMAGTALVTGLLSGACAIGSYIIQQASTQKMFATISEELQLQVIGIKECNTGLTQQNTALQDQNDTFKQSNEALTTEIALLALERKQYQSLAEQLKALAENTTLDQAQMKEQVGVLKEQVIAIQEIKAKQLPELIEAYAGAKEPFQALLKLLSELEDPKITLARCEEIKTSVSQLKETTRELQTVDKQLQETLQEIKVYRKLLLEHQQAHQEAHAEVIAKYQQNNERFSDLLEKKLKTLDNTQHDSTVAFS